MNRDEIVSRVEQGFAAWNAHDPGALMALYSEDAVEHDAGGETAKGREAIAERCRMFLEAFPDLEVELESMTVEGNTVTERWTATGTNTGPLQGMAPTGKRAVTEGCTIAELNDEGLVTSETDYWNEAAMMRQLGFLPEQAAATA